ncbi:Krueppel-like factor 1 [Cydia splendana]|uniref:Krueppel-like factor 1 n=1 Tax=Cydia splendana TaxID=1100963 RepID=UPI00300C5ED3
MPEHTPGTGPTGEDCRWRPAPLSVARVWPRLETALQAPGTRQNTHRGQALQVRTAGGALHHCLWPGCGRAFRQPCRLREHARAHTGDRPYRCKHPGCPWAFRTASKLLRHARRHTGERRHACACGRAFRRREHLREHQARHRRGTEGSDSTGRRVRSRMPALPAGEAGGVREGEGREGSEQAAPAPHDEFTDGVGEVHGLGEERGDNAVLETSEVNLKT